MAKQSSAQGLKPFQELNPWRVAMLPAAFKAYQGLSPESRELMQRLKSELAGFPPSQRYFSLRLDLNGPLARALSEPHLKLRLNAEYQLLRGEWVIVHLAEKAGKESREKGSQTNDRSRA